MQIVQISNQPQLFAQNPHAEITQCISTRLSDKQLNVEILIETDSVVIIRA